MTYILNLETSTINCSVSLALDGKLVVERTLNTGGYSHAEKLHVFIKDVLEEAKVKPENLSAIAVGKGPGSYTGLRIGVSAAKGLCFALGIPLIAIESLHLLALNELTDCDYIIPVLDARRAEVYCKVYNSHLEIVEDTHAKIIDQNSFESYLKDSKVVFVGDGAQKIKEFVGADKAIFYPTIYPSSIQMISLSYNMFTKKQFEDVAYFEPFYLKDFIAGIAKKA